jgi:hypothetical protein
MEWTPPPGDRARTRILLMRRAQVGDHEAYAALIGDLRPLLRGMLRRLAKFCFEIERWNLP